MLKQIYVKETKLKVVIESCPTLLFPVKKKSTVNAVGEKMKAATEIEKIKKSVNRL